MLCLAGGLAILLAGVFAGLSPVAGQASHCRGAFAAASVPTFACGLVAELVIRGGLSTTWPLPISQDTAFSNRVYREAIGQAARHRLLRSRAILGAIAPWLSPDRRGLHRQQ